jgi:hypothetical protein
MIQPWKKRFLFCTRNFSAKYRLLKDGLKKADNPLKNAGFPENHEKKGESAF